MRDGTDVKVEHSQCNRISFSSKTNRNRERAEKRKESRERALHEIYRTITEHFTTPCRRLNSYSCVHESGRVSSFAREPLILCQAAGVY
jgi:hypothetical protein